MFKTQTTTNPERDMNNSNNIASMNRPTPVFVAHLTHDDGRDIDTPTGTLCFSHGYYRKNGKPYTAKSVEKKFNKYHNWKGMTVVRVEVEWFDAEA